MSNISAWYVTKVNKNLPILIILLFIADDGIIKQGAPKSRNKHIRIILKSLRNKYYLKLENQHSMYRRKQLFKQSR